jgi:hypothetical protein
MAIATGQITITDFNDALTLTGFITANQPKTQQYNPDNASFTPSWATTNLVLTASLYKLGTSSDIIDNAAVTSITWQDAAAPGTNLVTGTDYTVAGKTLTVKTNILGTKPAIDFICTIVYHDASTNLDLTTKSSISFGKVTNGGGIADAVASLPNGNIFKNDQVNSLTAQCQLWRGSVIDTTLVTYQWYKQDSSVVTDQGGGVGWLKLTASSSETGYNATSLTIPNSAVLNIAVYKCIITDTDSTSNTYNKTFMDTVTIVDQSDPIQIYVTSSGGDVFKNGVGTTTLTAKVYQGGAEIDTAGTKYTYRWYKYDMGGTLITNFGGTGISYKAGKTLNIGDADVDTKATFSVEIS